MKIKYQSVSIKLLLASIFCSSFVIASDDIQKPTKAVLEEKVLEEDTTDFTYYYDRIKEDDSLASNGIASNTLDPSYAEKDKNKKELDPSIADQNKGKDKKTSSLDPLLEEDDSSEYNSLIADDPSKAENQQTAMQRSQERKSLDPSMDEKSKSKSLQNKTRLFNKPSKSLDTKPNLEKSFLSKKVDEDETVICQSLKKIILINPKYSAMDIKLEDTIQVYGLQIPGSAAQLQNVLEDFIGKPLTKLGLKELKWTIQDYYKGYGRPLVLVKIPAQSIRSGEVKFEITESRIDEIVVRDNKWFSKQDILKYIHLKPGEIIKQNVLVKDVNLINRNNFRNVDIVYTPGNKDDTTSIELYVNDRFPLRVYGGVENTGYDLTGRNRWFTGFNWGDAFLVDHNLSYQFTTTFAMHKFQSHTIHYQLPIFARHLLAIYGGISYVKDDANAGLVGVTSNNTIRSKGASYQASARYSVPLNPHNSFLHDVYAGVDFKRTDTNLDFTDVGPHFGRYVNIGQFVVGYNFTYDLTFYKTAFDIGVFFQPIRWLNDMSDNLYQVLRPHSDNKYVYAKASWSNMFIFPYNFTFSVTLKGQMANDNLLPSEWFYIGGDDTVRGYENHELGADDGFLSSFEFRTPSVSIFTVMSRRAKVKEGLQFLGFLDYGVVHSHQWVAGERTQNYLLGTGPGVRYVIEPYFTAKLDIGFRLHKDASFGGDNVMYHFLVSLSY